MGFFHGSRAVLQEFHVFAFEPNPRDHERLAIIARKMDWLPESLLRGRLFLINLSQPDSILVKNTWRGRSILQHKNDYNAEWKFLATTVDGAVFPNHYLPPELIKIDGRRRNLSVSLWIKGNEGLQTNALHRITTSRASNSCVLAGEFVIASGVLPAKLIWQTLLPLLDTYLRAIDLHDATSHC